MADFTVLDRNGRPLRYLEHVITFPNRERAYAFCGHNCTVEVIDIDAGAAPRISADEVSADYRQRYLDGYLAASRRAAGS